MARYHDRRPALNRTSVGDDDPGMIAPSEADWLYGPVPIGGDTGSNPVGDTSVLHGSVASQVARYGLAFRRRWAGYQPVNLTAATSARTIAMMPSLGGRSGRYRSASSATTMTAKARAHTALMT